MKSIKGCAAVCLAIIFFAALPLHAQESTPAPTRIVTADEVNAVAARLYCPECENVPLDVCGTQICSEWRSQIRAQLEAGRTSDEIVADFVNRFGERVASTPIDPALRAFSLLTPFIVAIPILLFAVWTIWRWWRSSPPLLNYDLPVSSSEITDTDDDYRARLERDLE